MDKFLSFLGGFVVAGIAAAATGVALKRTKGINLVDAVDKVIPTRVKIDATVDGKDKKVADIGDTSSSETN
jgi:hypothetical protein